MRVYVSRWIYPPVGPACKRGRHLANPREPCKIPRNMATRTNVSRPDKEPIIAWHLVMCMYGFWLPNDPRGSWSRYVASWGEGKWCGYLNRFELPRAIAYVQANPIKAGLPPQKWHFVTAPP